jgi:hypothetical protein
MTKLYGCFPSVARFGSRVTHLAVIVSVGLAAGSAATAQAFRSELLGHSNVIKVQAEAEASSPETVRVLAGIGEMRAAFALGLLFREAGLTNPKGSHFKTARAHIFPKIKYSLVEIGAPDLEPLLLSLEAANDKEAITAAFSAVEGALLRARSKIAPTSTDVIQAVYAMARRAAPRIKASGPTPVADYQDAWAIIMSARGELDLLMRDPDPTIAKLAAEEAMLFDDLIISLPDPNQPAPVAVDVGLFNDLVTQLEKLNNEA